MESGDRAPTDADISRSTEAVIKVTDDHGSVEYYTVHLDLFDEVDDLYEYIEDIFIEQYA